MHASPHRCLAVWAGITAPAAALAGWLGTTAGQAGVQALDAGQVGPLPFDRALVAVCAAAGTLATAWLWVAATAVVVEALAGARRRTPGVPQALRRAVLAGCGVAVVAGLWAPAQATPGELHLDRGRPATTLSGLPFPDRATGSPARRPSGWVLVRPGDTLWAIARAELGPAADDAAVDARWREIYAANRAVVGADPDLVRPAQRLRLPSR